MPLFDIRPLSVSYNTASLIEAYESELKQKLALREQRQAEGKDWMKVWDGVSSNESVVKWLKERQSEGFETIQTTAPISDGVPSALFVNKETGEILYMLPHTQRAGSFNPDTRPA